MQRLCLRYAAPRFVSILFLLAVVGARTVPAGPVEEAMQERIEVQEQSRQSQEKIDQLATETEDLTQRYREVLRNIEKTKSYNEQLRKQLAKQEEQLASFQRQFDEVEETQRNIVPLMSRMLEVLAELIKIDTPFLPEERKRRLAALQEMIYRPDVSMPDKFRRIMEAYQIEMDYGRNIEAYEGELQRAEDDNLIVEFLRLGRLGLYYQTLDGQESGYWDKQSDTWKTLPADFNQSIAQGLKIARKEAPPDLFRVPVPAPENAR